jgi:hypothetical protein
MSKFRWQYNELVSTQLDYVNCNPSASRSSRLTSALIRVLDPCPRRPSYPFCTTFFRMKYRFCSNRLNNKRVGFIECLFEDPLCWNRDSIINQFAYFPSILTTRCPVNPLHLIVPLSISYCSFNRINRLDKLLYAPPFCPPKYTLH